MSVNDEKQQKQDDIDGGRDYVWSYVRFIHYVEQLYQSAHLPMDEHSHNEKEAAIH